MYTPTLATCVNTEQYGEEERGAPAPMSILALKVIVAQQTSLQDKHIVMTTGPQGTAVGRCRWRI